MNVVRVALADLRQPVAGAARRGAKVAFHPHAHVHEPGAYVPSTFADLDLSLATGLLASRCVTSPL
jgi:hypothetical protein